MVLRPATRVALQEYCIVTFHAMQLQCTLVTDKR